MRAFFPEPQRCSGILFLYARADYSLYCLRNLDFVDNSRVVICGESAGGYMTLMLSSLQMGICAASARYPLINPYFNFNIHFRNAHKVNLEFQELGKGAQFSVIEYIYDAFMPSADSFASDKDIARWEAVSPLGLAECNSLEELESAMKAVTKGNYSVLPVYESIAELLVTAP